MPKENKYSVLENNKVKKKCWWNFGNFLHTINLGQQANEYLLA